MERIEKLFPRFDSNGKELILKAYRIAENALKDHRRSNGQPFIEHPIATAVIAYEEIGLPAECIAAIFLHEATRFFPVTDIVSEGFGNDIYTIVDGLNKIKGVYSPIPMGAFYTVASLPVEDADDFCAWCLSDFSYEGETVMMAPASGFYSTPGQGRNEVRIAYVLCKEDLQRALFILEKALDAYNNR